MIYLLRRLIVSDPMLLRTKVNKKHNDKLRFTHTTRNKIFCDFEYFLKMLQNEMAENA